MKLIAGLALNMKKFFVHKYNFPNAHITTPNKMVHEDKEPYLSGSVSTPFHMDCYWAFELQELALRSIEIVASNLMLKNYIL